VKYDDLGAEVSFRILERTVQMNIQCRHLWAVNSDLDALAVLWVTPFYVQFLQEEWLRRNAPKRLGQAKQMKN
jgi:hypothetical protein